MRLLVSGVSLLAILVGCAANPPIAELGPDTYILTRIDKGGIFGNAAAMKADVIREANQFAAQRGKVAVPLGVKETPLRPCPGCFASIEYQFRVVNRDDPEVRRGQLMPIPARSEITIKEQPSPPAAVSAVSSDRPARDIYSDLLKLDDLRKRGVLTDAEFASEKAKLLQLR